ncbi:unnamed protein product [Porites lobata]|uniref:Uncharacterized protein n=1 Tax=Porites lobata TaxID=104759 RepID=A0ABN8Q8D9_9CNID|nr:unnamed protein product [Porites lobata]
MVPVAVKMMNIVTINKKDKTEVTMAKSASAMMPREKKQVLNSSSSSLEASSEHLSLGMRVSKNLTVECQPTDADHEGTSIEEDEVVLKKASKKGQEGAQDKRIQTWLEADQRREEAFLKYQEKQAELNRQYELRRMEIMARFQQPV